MTDETITDFIRASREICDKATPGPWEMEAYQDGESIACESFGPSHPYDNLAEAEADQCFINYARTALPRALDMLGAQQAQIADRDRAVDLLADAIGKVEAQAKQIADLRDELADESAVSADWHRYYIALSDLAHGDKPTCLAPDVCEEHGPCKSCAVYEQQSRMDEALTNQRRTLAAETDEALAKLAKVQSDASAKIAEQQAEIVRLRDGMIALFQAHGDYKRQKIMIEMLQLPGEPSAPVTAEEFREFVTKDKP